MISDDRLTKALTYLAETDERAAELFANMGRAEFKAKAVKDALIKHGEGGLGDRTAAAGCAEEYTKAQDEYFAAVESFRAVNNKRDTESLIVDVWRTEQANRRQGAV